VAWEVVDLTLDNFVTSKSLSTDYYNYPVSDNNDLYIEGTNLIGYITVDNEWHTIYDNGIMKIDALASTYPNQYGFQLYYNNQVCGGASSGGYNDMDFIGFGFAVDETNEIGMFYSCYHSVSYPSQYRIYPMVSEGRPEDQRNTYLAIKSYIPPVQTYISNGGGATHIAKVTGQLSSLSNNLSDILIVSGGGGGGMLIGETEYTGADAGGISGNSTNSADQTTGYAFGQGESSSNVSGGGGGLYGGYKGIVV